MAISIPRESRMMIGAAGDGSTRISFRDLVLNAFDLKNRVARDVMRPRREIEGFNTTPVFRIVLLAERDIRDSPCA